MQSDPSKRGCCPSSEKARVKLPSVVESCMRVRCEVVCELYIVKLCCCAQLGTFLINPVLFTFCVSYTLALGLMLVNKAWCFTHKSTNE